MRGFHIWKLFIFAFEFRHSISIDCEMNSITITHQLCLSWPKMFSARTIHIVKLECLPTSVCAPSLDLFTFNFRFTNSKNYLIIFVIDIIKVNYPIFLIAPVLCFFLSLSLPPAFIVPFVIFRRVIPIVASHLLASGWKHTFAETEKRRAKARIKNEEVK